MKVFYLIAILFLLGCNPPSKTKVLISNNEYKILDSYFKIINDLSTGSHFLVVSVVNNIQPSFKAVIQNDDLYYLISKSKNLSIKKYIEMFKLQEKNELLIDVSFKVYDELLRYNYENSKCNNVSYTFHDSKTVISKYFKVNGVLKKEFLGQNIEICLIEYLFENSIFTFKDDETGILIIDQNL